MSVDCVNQLAFHRPLTLLVKESLVVRNSNNRPVAFKIKTTAPKQYCVRPNSGRIEPGQEVEVQVLLQAMKEEPPMDYKCRDKFLVQSTVISAENESLSISVLWNAVESKNRQDIHEKKIRVAFVSADGSGGYQNASHETYRDSSPAPAYHGASETSTSHGTPVQSSSSGFAGSEVFRAAPALPSLQTIESTSSQPKSNTLSSLNNNNNNNNSNISNTTTSSSTDSQLKEARLEIERLQQELRTARSSKGGATKTTTAAHNEGVPVPMTAMIALIAFMAAYLLF